MESKKEIVGFYMLIAFNLFCQRYKIQTKYFLKTEIVTDMEPYRKMQESIPFNCQKMQIQCAFINESHLQRLRSNSSASSKTQSNILSLSEDREVKKICGFRSLDSVSLCNDTAHTPKMQCKYRLTKLPPNQIDIQFHNYLTSNSNKATNKNVLPIQENKEEQFYGSKVKNEITDMDLEENNNSREKVRESENKKKMTKKQLRRQEMLDDPEGQEMIREYKSLKNQNSMKNIKEAFIRHLNSSLSDELKQHYVKLMGGKLLFGQIKKKINFSLKENTTNNKCVKFMCKSNQVSPIFHYFLQNIDEYWLNQSKVSQKDACRQIAIFLIKIIKDSKCISLIEHYHTKV